MWAYAVFIRSMWYKFILGAVIYFLIWILIQGLHNLTLLRDTVVDWEAVCAVNSGLC